MATSKAKTVKEYLEELPEERRAVVSALRKLIRAHLPKGYQESMSWGVISYEIPLKDFPDTYNGQPLTYIALAAQKNHFALYLMCIRQPDNQKDWLKNEFKKAGKKFDMGKSCLRFKKLDDLPLDVIGQVVAATTPEQYLEYYKASRASREK